jgi:cytidylate kinase
MTASVITFTFQEGTGGSSIAQLVAARLGYAYLDEEIVLRAGRLAGVSPQVIAESERWGSFSQRLLRGLAVMQRSELPPAGIPAQSDAVTEPIDPRYYHFFVDNAVLQAAHTGSCVIAGHAAQATLRGRGPGVCSVLVYGSAEARAARIASEKGITQTEALTCLRSSDRDQAGFLKHAYRTDWLDPSLYQLMLNTDELTDPAAAEVIARLATKLSDSSEAGRLRRVVANRQPGAPPPLLVAR